MGCTRKVVRSAPTINCICNADPAAFVQITKLFIWAVQCNDPVSNEYGKRLHKIFYAISITNIPPIRSVQGGEPKRAETDTESEDRFREHDGSAAQRRPFTLMGWNDKNAILLLVPISFNKWITSANMFTTAQLVTNPTNRPAEQKPDLQLI